MAIPLIGTSESIEKIRELIEHVADTGLNVIITGESGVGKEVVAQNLFHESQRKDGALLPVLIEKNAENSSWPMKGLYF